MVERPLLCQSRCLNSRVVPMKKLEAESMSLVSQSEMFTFNQFYGHIAYRLFLSPLKIPGGRAARIFPLENLSCKPFKAHLLQYDAVVAIELGSTIYEC